jgi:hypothetical protein
MASYMLRKVPGGLIPRAKAQAQEAGTTLDTVLIAFLAVYAESGAYGAAGGHARAEALTPERRQDIARTAAQARWRAR